MTGVIGIVLEYDDSRQPLYLLRIDFIDQQGLLRAYVVQHHQIQYGDSKVVHMFSPSVGRIGAVSPQRSGYFFCEAVGILITSAEFNKGCALLLLPNNLVPGRGAHLGDIDRTGRPIHRDPAICRRPVVFPC